MIPTYAKGFSVATYQSYKVITVNDIRDNSKVIAEYVLTSNAELARKHFPKAVILDGFSGKVVCVSTNHIAQMAKLNLADSISGVTNVSLIYNTYIQDAILDNRIADLGNDELNYEKLVELQPWFVFTSGDWDGGDKLKMKLRALNVKSVLNLDYMEQEPLARAEWIKFVAAFFDKETEADSVFKRIEKNYLTLKKKAESVSAKPVVFSNLPFKEVWYMPCGDNYMAKLIADAGGNFLWKDTKSTNGLNLNLDYETVYNKAANADYWVNSGFAKSLDEIKAADKKNTFFKAYKTGLVFNNDKRNTPAGGFDFWESGAVNPDNVLADLIFIFHPGLLPQHKLYYYRKLQ